MNYYKKYLKYKLKYFNLKKNINISGGGHHSDVNYLPLDFEYSSSFIDFLQFIKVKTNTVWSELSNKLFIQCDGSYSDQDGTYSSCALIVTTNGYRYQKYPFFYIKGNSKNESDYFYNIMSSLNAEILGFFCSICLNEYYFNLYKIYLPIIYDCNNIFETFNQIQSLLIILSN
jgi:hypothetical protein